MLRRGLGPLGALGALMLAGAALAGGLTAKGVLFTPYGHGNQGSIGRVLPLSPNAILVAATGPDGGMGTEDDVVLLVTNFAGDIQFTPLATPYLSNFSGSLARLSATRALAFTAGQDGDWRTADDSLLLLDRLGSDNLSTEIVVGYLDVRDGHSPVGLSANRALVASVGPDGNHKTGDDRVVLVSNLGGTPTTQNLAAPRLQSPGQAQPVALSPTSFLVSSTGPDGTPKTADDVIYLFTGVGTSNSRTDLPTPNLAGRSPGRAVRVTATRALVTSAGPDGTEENGDDRVYLLDGLGTANTVTPIPVPGIHAYGAGQCVPLSPTLAVLSTGGPNFTQENADDTLAILSGLGGTVSVTHVTIGGLDEDRSSVPVRLSPTSVLVCTGGANFILNSPDDELVLVTGIGTTNTVTRIARGGLDWGATSEPAVIDATAVALTTGGPSGVVGAGGDDTLTVVTGLGPGALSESIGVVGEIDAGSPSGAVRLLGQGLAALISGGAVDGEAGQGNDDVIRVVFGLPTGRHIRADKVNINLKKGNPGKVTGVSASGLLALDDPELLAGCDITVSVGNAAQTIPASAFKRKKNNVFQYTDSKNKQGWVKSLKLAVDAGTFSVSGVGKGAGAENTAAAYLPVAIEAGGLYLPDFVVGSLGKKGIAFKR